MASGFFFGGMAPGILQGANAFSKDMQLQSLMQLQVAQNEHNQKRASAMKLWEMGVDNLQKTVSALKDHNPGWTDQQILTHPATVAAKNLLNIGGFAKNLGFPDGTVDNIVASTLAQPGEIQKEGALARAKEGPQHQQLVQSEIAKNRAMAGQNPDAPGLPANGPALGDKRAASFNQRFAQTAETDAPKVLSWGDARSLLSQQYGPDKVMKAELFLKGNANIISGLRGSGRNSERQQIQDIAMSLGRLVGMDPDQINQNFVEFAGKKAAATAGGRTAGTREANLGIILTAADSAIDAAITASNNVPRTNLVPLTRAQQLGQAAISDPNLKVFQQKNLQLAELWAKSFNPTGVLRNEDRALALDVLNTALGQGTYETAARSIRDSIGLEKSAAIKFLKERGFSVDSSGKGDSTGAEPGPGGVTVHGFTFTPTGQ